MVVVVVVWWCGGGGDVVVVVVMAWWWWLWWRCGGGNNDSVIVRRLKRVRRYRHIIRRDKMIRCLICNQSYSRHDALKRHKRNVHGSGKNIHQLQPLKEITFQHPFSMMVTGPSGSGKTEWTRKLLLISLIQPPPERILWCFGQWQPCTRIFRREFHGYNLCTASKTISIVLSLSIQVNGT